MVLLVANHHNRGCFRVINFATAPIPTYSYNHNPSIKKASFMPMIYAHNHEPLSYRKAAFIEDLRSSQTIEDAELTTLMDTTYEADTIIKIT